MRLNGTHDIHINDFSKTWAATASFLSVVWTIPFVVQVYLFEWDMANYRSLHVKIWADPEFEDFSPESKYIFIYLITNPHRNESAVYSISPQRISSETGLPKAKVERALRDLCDAEKIMYSFERKVVWVKNAVRHQPAMNENCRKSILNDLERCSDPTIANAFVDYYRDFKGLEGAWEGLPSPPYRVQGTGDRVQGEEEKVVEEKKTEQSQSKTTTALAPIPLPEGLLARHGFSEVWSEWLEFRRSIKKPLTEIAAKKQLKMLETHPNPEAVLELSMQNQWQGLFPEKVYGNGRTNGQGTRQSEQIARATFGHDEAAKKRLRDFETRLSERDRDRSQRTGSNPL